LILALDLLTVILSPSRWLRLHPWAMKMGRRMEGVRRVANPRRGDFQSSAAKDLRSAISTARTVEILRCAQDDGSMWRVNPS
jgi:hypothetical protein